MAGPFTAPVDISVPFDGTEDSDGIEVVPPFESENVRDGIIEARNTAVGIPRFTVNCTSNGIVGNNEWLGPNELMPNTPMVVFPFNAKIEEISWANQNSEPRFHIEFRRNSKTGTIFHTLTVDTTNPGYGYETGLDLDFAPGEVIYAQYKDDGQNCSDFAMTLWLSRVI